MTSIEKIRRLSDWALARAIQGQPVALLFVRWSLAAVFIPSGWGKIHDLAKVTAYFTELGIPSPHANAILVSLTELGCGVLLLLGIVGRLAALPIVANMVVAVITAKREELHGIADLFALDEFIYIVLSLVVITLGPGLFSIDALLVRMRGRNKPR